MNLQQLQSNKSFGGSQLRFKHDSAVNQCEMTFSIYLPAKPSPAPVIYWLSGLTCSDENFVQKAGAQQFAAKYGVVIVAPDTSPRGESVPDDAEGGWDFGLGAGFYLDAIQSPWSLHYKMYSYITRELPEIINGNFPVLSSRVGIMGHSMGGHGALTIALKNPDKYRSVSAFAPICAPMQCPWGKKAFSHYLGNNTDHWAQYDTCQLIANGKNSLPLFIDQGTDDNFLQQQLLPAELENVCRQHKHPLNLRMQEGYDHSYFFIATFIEDHIRYHRDILTK